MSIKNKDTDVDPKDESIDESEEETTDESTEEEEESEEEESETDESTEEESDEEDDSKKNDLDLDAELEKERGAGEPDPKIADEAFKNRDKKRKAGEGANDGDRPLTQKDLDAALARDRKERQRDDALVIAKGMAGSDKEAELIVLKWANRTFPKNLSLREQMQEAYVITHSKKLIGERDEAMRGLKGQRGVKRDAAGTHKDAQRNANEPKLSPADAASIRASGFTWNNVNRQYEKKLPNGHLLIRDSKTKQVRLQKKK
jgi:hypothetical protein